MEAIKRVYTIAEIQGRLRPVFEKYPVYKAILFGSYARGDAIHNSDIDIMVDTHKELMDIRFYGLLEDITVTMNADIDLIELSEIEADSPILREIMEQGVTIYER